MVRGNRHVVLIGMMGAGKTTVGRLVAAQLGWAFWDNDEALVQATDKTAADVQRERGQAALHQTEHRLLRQALRGRQSTVYAAAGSVVLNPGVLRGALTIWLRLSAADEELHIARSGQDHRPLPGDAAPLLEGLVKTRQDQYGRLADAVVDVASTPALTCERVIRAIDAITQTA